MKNIAISGTWSFPLPGCNITTTIVDVDRACVWIASERVNADADTEVDIYQKGLPDDLFGIEDVAPTELVTKLVSSTSKVVPNTPSQVISLKTVPGEDSLAVIMRGGDIWSMKLGNPDPQFETIGSFEDGIQAAAWCPDDSLLVLVTGEGKLIVMTLTFDVLHESALHTDEFGEDVPINVGWGSKQTQFHGSLGKAAAHAPSAPASSSVGISPDDDLLTRISWRGDGALFVVSAVAPAAGSTLLRRVLRIYNRDGMLQTTAEAVPGLEHPLSWRPSGNLIVGVQRFGAFPGGGKGREGRHDVVFFEKNGLRHGEFGLRCGTHGVGPSDAKERKWGYKVKEVCWSADSSVLLVWIEEDAGDAVQLWTTGNYHWYLKQEIACLPAEGGRYTSVAWHPEKPLLVLLTTKTHVISYSFRWETSTATARAPNDTGTVAVIDGSSILLTPFRMQNIPPPMSSHRLTLRRSPLAPARTLSTPCYVRFSPTEDILAALWETGYLEVWNLHTRLEFGRGPVMAPERIWCGSLEGARFREISVCMNAGQNTVTLIAALGYESNGVDLLQVLEIEQENENVNALEVPRLGSLGWRLALTCGAVVLHRNGKMLEYDVDSEQLVPSVDFGTACDVARVIDVSQSLTSPAILLYLGLTSSGTLLSTTPSSPARTLAQNANSFAVSGDLIVYTTFAHEAHFIPASLLATVDASTDITSERRRVERGSRIVTAIPSIMSLVLQMPRGNLETVNPRPMVMTTISADIDAGNYRKAFLACRKHRIDLNVIVDRNPDLFRERLSSFIEQVRDVDYINLFLTNLGQGSQPPEVISELCDAIREQLEAQDTEMYINSILTAYVVKRPPDLEAGLRVLLRLREHVPSAIEDAVKYIIFLVDADTLFDVALGMYDFSLVLLVAQHAQKDPREYLPFLRELRALEKYYQRFRIDDHLRRYKIALQNLSLAGPEHFDEVKAYVEKHQLYETALEIYRETDQHQEILNLYGEWLFERREFVQSASAFMDAQRFQRAMLAYEKAHLWRELFELAQLQRIVREDIVAIACRVAEDLTSKKRHLEAGQVLLDYAEDVREAVIALVQGNHFSEARRIITLHEHPELLEEIIDPAVLEARTQIAEDLAEMHEQLQKQVARLRELRVKKVEEREEFYGTEDLAVHNVDVMTEASAFTAFTRYTAAPTASGRKMERKVGSGRKGTVDEEEYLLKSLTKLAARLETTQGTCSLTLKSWHDATARHVDETAALVPHLLRFTSVHRAAARELQNEVAAFSQEVAEAFDEVWPASTGEVETTAEPPDSWATRMAEREKERERTIKAITKPGLRAVESWRTRLLDDTATSASPEKT
ncbi:IkappaB kinase complex IKAP component [Russula earlei]|uniref:IkappaB kinase complex IKAP component n=1 Tax=Russula earlei TaxID=71964 RepID=A0ACC0U1W2_9AGAM|nr:IkappaB kinase complex IKAP component [Russula earlei]